MKKDNLVSVPFMVLGIVFCVCLVAANLLETKVVQLGPISITAGLLVFLFLTLSMTVLLKSGASVKRVLSFGWDS